MENRQAVFRLLPNRIDSMENSKILRADCGFRSPLYGVYESHFGGHAAKGIYKHSPDDPWWYLFVSFEVEMFLKVSCSPRNRENRVRWNKQHLMGYSI